MAGRRYPSPQGQGQGLGGEELPHAPKPEARGGGREEIPLVPRPRPGVEARRGNPHLQGAVAVRAQYSLEELLHIQGQKGRQ